MSRGEAISQSWFVAGIATGQNVQGQWVEGHSRISNSMEAYKHRGTAELTRRLNGKRWPLAVHGPAELAMPTPWGLCFWICCSFILDRILRSSGTRRGDVFHIKTAQMNG